MLKDPRIWFSAEIESFKTGYGEGCHSGLRQLLERVSEWGQQQGCQEGAGWCAESMQHAGGSDKWIRWGYGQFQTICLGGCVCSFLHAVKRMRSPISGRRSHVCFVFTDHQSRLKFIPVLASCPSGEVHLCSHSAFLFLVLANHSCKHSGCGLESPDGILWAEVSGWDCAYTVGRGWVLHPFI